MALNIKSKYVSDILSVVNTKIIVLLLGLVGTVFISRGLGADGRGLLAALLIYPQLLVSVFEGGMRQAAMLYLGKKKATEKEVISALFLFTLVASFIGYSLALYLIYQSAEGDINLILIFVASIVLPLSLMVSALRGVFLGKQKIQRFNKLSWVEKTIYAIGVCFLFMFGFIDVFSVLLLTVASSFINLLIGLYFFYKDKPQFGTFKITLMWDMLKIGFIYGLAFFFIELNYKVDILLLTHLSTNFELGQYTLAVKLGELLWQLPGAVVVVLLSKGVNSSSKDMVPVVTKTARLTLLISFFCSICLITASYLFVVPIFGDDFSNVANIVLALMPGLLLMVLFKTVNSHFAGQGKPHFAIKIMSIAVVINVLLNFILIPKYQALGAAIASAISYAVASIIAAGMFCFNEKIPLKELIIIQRDDLKPLIKIIKKRKKGYNA